MPETSTDRAEAVNRILDAAERCFEESGFKATSVKRIATEAGVSSALVHYHFATKEKLLFEVLDRLLDATRERVRVASAKRRPGLEAGLGALDVVGSLLERWSRLMSVVSELDTGGPGAREAFARGMAFAIEAQAVIERAIRSTVGDDVSRLAVPPDRLALLILNCLHGIAISGRLAGPGAVAQQLEDLKTLLARSTDAPEGGS